VTAGNRVRVSCLLLILKWSISESSRITSYYKSHPTSPSSGQAAVCSQLRHSILSACHSGAALDVQAQEGVAELRNRWQSISRNRMK